MSTWAKLASDVHRHPKVRRGGRNAREVFVFVLAINADHGSTGRVPAAFVDPWYLADQLQCSEDEARDGLTRAVAVRLLELDAATGDALIVGWDADEWGRGERSMTEAERKRQQRQEKRSARVSGQRLDSLDTSGMSGPGEERRSEEKRGEEPPIPPKGGIEIESKPGRRKPKPSEPTETERATAMRVLGKVGERNGISYQGSEPHVRLISRHLRDGLTERELRGVAAYVWSELGWGEKDEMRPHFVPETLFGPQKIHKYLPGARAWLAKVFADEPKQKPGEPAIVIDLFRNQESA